MRPTGGELPVVYDSSLSVNYIEVGKFTKCGVNQMWILKTSKDLLEYIQSKPLLLMISVSDNFLVESE
jgi:hypothetical protein